MIYHGTALRIDGIDGHFCDVIKLESPDSVPGIFPMFLKPYTHFSECSNPSRSIESQIYILLHPLNGCTVLKFFFFLNVLV
jgi:hypothetical protein